MTQCTISSGWPKLGGDVVSLWYFWGNRQACFSTTCHWKEFSQLTSQGTHSVGQRSLKGNTLTFAKSKHISRGKATAQGHILHFQEELIEHFVLTATPKESVRWVFRTRPHSRAGWILCRGRHLAFRIKSDGHRKHSVSTVVSFFSGKRILPLKH